MSREWPSAIVSSGFHLLLWLSWRRILPDSAIYRHDGGVYRMRRPAGGAAGVRSHLHGRFRRSLMDTGRPPAVIITPHLMFGLMILLLGVVFALDNLDVVAARRFLDYWPVGLILIGAAKLWEVQTGHGRPVGGILFIAAGAWLLLDSLDLIDVSLFAFWPVLLIIAGG